MDTRSSDTNSNGAREASRRRSSRLKLWLVLALCAAPVAASFIAYYWMQPQGHVNYGELLTPQPMPDAPLKALDGSTFRFDDLKGAWVLLTAGGAACDERCRTKLVYTRQVRLAQGKNSERIERVWLVTDDKSPDAALLAEHPGLHVVSAGAGAAARALPAQTIPAAHVYVVDPLGNLMMRFPENPDPRRMLKDVSRLLRHSNWK